MWIYQIADSNIVMSTMLFYYFTNSCASVTLNNPSGQSVLPTYYTQNFGNQWIFGAYSISFTSGTTTVTYTTYTTDTTGTTAATATNVLSINGYAFYDAGSPMWIGKNGSYTDIFYGFIYSFTLWQTAITDFTTAYDTCGAGLGNSCVWNCGLDQYYKSYEDTCENCDASCTDGCVTWGTCAYCIYPGCTSCTDFYSTCTSTALTPCVSPYTYTANYV